MKRESNRSLLGKHETETATFISPAAKISADRYGTGRRSWSRGGAPNRTSFPDAVAAGWEPNLCCSRSHSGSLALFPIQHQHEAQQQHARWPHARNDAVPEKFSVGDELEQSDSESDGEEPHMLTLDPKHRVGHNVVVRSGGAIFRSHRHRHL